MELPSYRMPHVRDIAIGLWRARARSSCKRVGGIILSLTVLLWFLSSFPGPPAGATGPAIDYSLAGRLGHALHYVFAPIGFNWQICIALVPACAAREVAVSALGTVYAMSGGDDAIASQLGALIAHQWSLATALVAAGLVRVCAAVHVDPGGDPPRDQLLAQRGDRSATCSRWRTSASLLTYQIARLMA